MDEGKYIAEDRISLKGIVEGMQKYVQYLLTRWKRILSISGVIALLFFLKMYLDKPEYTAETTFVIDTGKDGAGGEFSSLASLVGINIGNMSSSSTLFQTENIIDLYKSRKMLMETFLSSLIIDGNQERLITRWAREKKKLGKWQKKLEMPDFSFEIPDSQLTIAHDSILFQIIDDFRKDNLQVKKPDRKKSTLSVKIIDTDQLFALHFNQILVKKVNDFYLLTKTKKSGDNVSILQKQADSIRSILDNSIDVMGQTLQETANPNPALATYRSPIHKVKLDVESSTIIYLEIVKNLEIAKIAHRNNAPLIQVIDEPLLPLKSNRFRKLLMIAISIFLSGLITLTFYTFRYLYQNAMKRSS